MVSVKATAKGGSSRVNNEIQNDSGQQGGNGNSENRYRFGDVARGVVASIRERDNRLHHSQNGSENHDENHDEVDDIFDYQLIQQPNQRKGSRASSSTTSLPSSSSTTSSRIDPETTSRYAILVGSS